MEIMWIARLLRRLEDYISLGIPNEMNKKQEIQSRTTLP